MLIVEEGKRLNVLIKEINTCMHDHILYHGKDFYRYCLQAFSTEEILKRHIRDCFKINGKHMMKMPIKVKIKLRFMIYADFQNILAPDDK